MTPSRSRCETISIGESGRRSGLCRVTHGDVIPQVSGAEALCRVLTYRKIPAQLIVNDAGHASEAATRLDAIHPARRPCAAAASVPHRSRPGPNSDVRDWCRKRTSASCSRPQMCQVRASLPRCCGMICASDGCHCRLHPVVLRRSSVRAVDAYWPGLFAKLLQKVPRRLSP